MFIKSGNIKLQMTIQLFNEISSMSIYLWCPSLFWCLPYVLEYMQTCIVQFSCRILGPASKNHPWFSILVCFLKKNLSAIASMFSSQLASRWRSRFQEQVGFYPICFLELSPSSQDGFWLGCF